MQLQQDVAIAGWLALLKLRLLLASSQKRLHILFQGTNQPRMFFTFADNSSIFIRNLSWGLDDAALQRHISAEVDGLTNVRVFTKSNGRSMGMALVDFESPEAAQQAVQVRILASSLCCIHTWHAGRANAKRTRTLCPRRCMLPVQH